MVLYAVIHYELSIFVPFENGAAKNSKITNICKKLQQK